METTCAIRYVNGDEIEDGFTGFISDTILRELGIQLVDGRMPGFAAVLGPAPSNEKSIPCATKHREVPVPVRTGF